MRAKIVNQMVKFNENLNAADQRAMDHTFAALSDSTRRAIVARMAEAGSEGVSVSDLAEPFAMSLPAVSKHLRVLERAGLLRQEKDGRVRRCRLNPQPLNHANQWVEQYRQFWTRQLDSLVAYLENEDEQE